MIKCCTDCVAPKRHIGCHATCKEYLGEKQVHDARLELIRHEKQMETSVIDSIIGNVRKSAKHSKK